MTLINQIPAKTSRLIGAISAAVRPRVKLNNLKAY